MNNITDLKAWQELDNHYQKMKNILLRDQFDKDPKRFEKFSLQAADITLDYSKNRITEETLEGLCQLANECQLKSKITDMFSGKKINTSEEHAVMHTACRNLKDDIILIDGENIAPDIHAILEKMQKYAEKIHQGQWLGYSGKAITDVVNIGIGGSNLGPSMVSEALTPYHLHKIRLHFVSNVDPAHLSRTLEALNPETTLFIVSSKSFTTLETLTNAKSAKAWLNKPDNQNQHFIAITSQPEKAEQFGVLAENVFPMHEWIGGRFSLWSAIGFPIVLAIGFDRFKELLQGAYEMDQHFLNAPFSENMPVILALLSIWYVNFFKSQSYAILPYDQLLLRFPDFLKQLEMESNGKHVCIDGKPTHYPTGPIVWGEIGCNGQHAFHQILHQGSYLVPADFIIALESHFPLEMHHKILFADCLSQSQAMMRGCTENEVFQKLLEQGYSETAAKKLAPHQFIPGNEPSNTIIYRKLTPKTLGALIALYEHKTFVQGAIWNINSFDQWGVELGKQLALNILDELNNTDGHTNSDSSTQGLIRLYKRDTTGTK